MPDQGSDPYDPDQWPDPDQWLADFKSRLSDLVNPASPSDLAGIPGVLGSLQGLRGATGTADPTVIASAAQRPPNAAGALAYHAAPSPHAGHYATLDEAAKAAASDVPKNPYVEYGAYLPERYATENIDLGDGYGPQSISHLDGYDYGGLYTSTNDAKVTLGCPPANLGGWFHNHPWDPAVDNLANQGPSPGSTYDEGTINFLHKDNPQMETYILGPDGVLRKFLRPADRGEIVK